VALGDSIVVRHDVVHKICETALNLATSLKQISVFVCCRYRVLAVDHGMISFVDVKHGDWPVALVTNPKHALFMMPAREPADRVLHSTHIRYSVDHFKGC
jgi:hypothetical protein